MTDLIILIVLSVICIGVLFYYLGKLPGTLKRRDQHERDRSRRHDADDLH